MSENKCEKCGKKGTKAEHLYELEQRRRVMVLCLRCYHRVEDNEKRAQERLEKK